MRTPSVRSVRCQSVIRAACLHAVRQRWGFRGLFARWRCEQHLLYGETVRRECNDTFVKITNGVWRVFDQDGATPSGDIAHQLGVAVTRARPHSMYVMYLLVVMIVLGMMVRRIGYKN